MSGVVLMKTHSNKNLTDVKSITVSSEVCYEETLVIKVSTPQQGWPSQMLVCHKAWDLKKKNLITSFPTVVSIAFSDLLQCSVSVWNNTDSPGPPKVKVPCIYCRIITHRICTLIKLSRHIFYSHLYSSWIVQRKFWTAKIIFFNLGIFLIKCFVTARGFKIVISFNWESSEDSDHLRFHRIAYECIDWNW